jgi:hypothetical protein
MDAPPVAPAVICPCCNQTIPTQFRCEACGRPFMPIKAAQRFCCKACSKAQWRRVKNNVKNLDQPYLRKPRSPKALEAAGLQREQKQEVTFKEAKAAQAPDNNSDDYFAQIMAEAEAEERAEGLHDTIRPKCPQGTDDPDVPSTFTPLLPPKAPQWVTTRAARLMAYRPFSI